MNITKHINSLNYDIKSLLIIQCYSMREDINGISYYVPQKDGNLNHTLHTLYGLSDTIEKLYLTVPTSTREEDLNELINLIERVVPEIQTILIPIKYGLNIAETRKLFSYFGDLNSLYSKYMDSIDFVICDFEKVIIEDSSKILYRFNVTNDNILKKQQEIAKRFSISVFNQYQIDSIGNQFDIFQDRNWFSTRVLDKIASYNNEIEIEINHKTIFLPFRLTDADYKIDEIFKETLPKGYHYILTDPNNSIDIFYKKYPELIGRVRKFKEFDEKGVYYSFLESLKYRENVQIIYLSNPTKLLHQSSLELLHFCPNCLKFNWDILDEDIENIIETYYA